MHLWWILIRSIILGLWKETFCRRRIGSISNLSKHSFNHSIELLWKPKATKRQSIEYFSVWIFLSNVSPMLSPSMRLTRSSLHVSRTPGIYSTNTTPKRTSRLSMQLHSFFIQLIGSLTFDLIGSPNGSNRH